jgi:dynein heavy chain
MIGWEMMGAGTDPLKRNQDFARLTGDLKTLMQTKFLFPKDSQARSLPIIDVFARTLACPISTQRQNPVVAARIGSNLSISTQFLFITPEGMKWIPTASDNLDKRKKREVINILSEQE